MTKSHQPNILNAQKHYKRAREAYELASKRLSSLQAPTTLDALEDDWEQYLSAYVRCQGHLYNAVKSAGNAVLQSQIGDEFKKDDKLAYLHQARNEDEHGCEVGRYAIPDIVSFGRFHFAGADQHIDMSGVEMRMALPDGREVPLGTIDDVSIKKVGGRIVESKIKSSVPVRVQERFLRLRKVTNRGVDYAVPSGLGEPPRHAVVLAEYGLNWLELKLSQVSALLPKP